MPSSDPPEREREAAAWTTTAADRRAWTRQQAQPTGPGQTPLVSICLPVRNAASTLTAVVESVLAQTYPHVELVIFDNASTDDSQEVCRKLAIRDPRITYLRQPENVGLLANFVAAMRAAKGQYFRWIGDDDWLAPDYVARCVDRFAADPRLILVTTRIAYLGDDGVTRSASYHRTGLASDQPVDRFVEMLRLLNDSYLLIDPMYALMRRAAVATIPRHNMLREDEVFAAKLALAGPWGHLDEALAGRHWATQRPGAVAHRLGVPVWRARFALALETRELLRVARDSRLTPAERRRARAAVLRFYLGRHRRVAARRARKLVALFRGVPDRPRPTTEA